TFDHREAFLLVIEIKRTADDESGGRDGGVLQMISDEGGKLRQAHRPLEIEAPALRRARALEEEIFQLRDLALESSGSGLRVGEGSGGRDVDSGDSLVVEGVVDQDRRAGGRILKYEADDATEYLVLV